MSNRVLIGLFFFGTAALLIGQRFGFRWAGGEGYARQEPFQIARVEGVATVDRAGVMRDARAGEVLLRGETLRTEAGGRVLLYAGDQRAYLALDERTDVRLESLSDRGAVIKLGRGRIVTLSTRLPFTVSTNHTEHSFKDGRVSFVNYDFRSDVSVLPLSVVPVVSRLDGGRTWSTVDPMDIHEVPPISFTQTTFDPDKSVAASFYAWANQRIRSVR